MTKSLLFIPRLETLPWWLVTKTWKLKLSQEGTERGEDVIMLPSTPQLSVSRSQGAAEEVLDEHDYLTYLNQVRRYSVDSV